MGQPMDHVLRQCLIALGLAERIGLDEAEREVVYFGSLLAWVGCHVDAYEQAKWFGDETVAEGRLPPRRLRRPRRPRRCSSLRHLGAGRAHCASGR